MNHILDGMNGLKQGEHLGRDGLAYCDACGTPRQKLVDLVERKILVRCQCRCQAEQARAQEKARKALEFQDRVARNRSVGMREKTLRQCTFANDSGRCPEISAAKKYVAHWDQMLEKSMGLLLWGGVGTGKTYMAACIANALLDRGVAVMMTNFPRILGEMPGQFSGDRNRYIDSFSAYPLLIIDDLGVERGSEYSLEQVFTVIDARYRARLPLIVTTNLTLEEMKDPDSVAKKRIYDRILERCVPLMINGNSLRQENARANMEWARGVLR